MEDNKQGRNWCFVINNPKLTEQDFYNYLKNISNVRYFIFVREKGAGSNNNPTGTEHHQGYIEFLSPKKFSTMKAIFSEKEIGVNGHIEPRKFTRTTCINYVKKIGLYQDKSFTHISQIFEYGTNPVQGKRTDLNEHLTELFELSVNGATGKELFYTHPLTYARFKNFIDQLSYDCKVSEYKEKRRNLEVVYIYGKAGCGKTKYVMDKHKDKNVYRFTDYKYDDNLLFDGYRNQDIIVFEEFRSGIQIEKLLNYMDVYNVELPARYHPRIACYSKVYFLTNIPIQEQYYGIFKDHYETWCAFLRRINKIYNFDNSKTDIERKIEFKTPYNKEYVIYFNEEKNCYNCSTKQDYEDMINPEPEIPCLIDIVQNPF